MSVKKLVGEDIKQLVFNELLSEYTEYEIHDMLERAKIEYELNIVTVTYDNGVVDTFEISYEPKLKHLASDITNSRDQKDWKTTWDKRSILSDSEYNKITNCGIGDVSNALPRFNIEDIQRFLIERGYKIIVAKYERKHSNDNRTWMEIHENVFAVKPNEYLPQVLDANEASMFEIVNVFRRIMKEKLMAL